MYSKHTHVRTGANICVYTCAVMSVHIRNHVNTHLRGGFYSRPNQIPKSVFIGSGATR